MSNNIAVKIEGLRHFYGDREALRGIDVTIDTGEIFGLLGPNGGGKSTLFRLLTTLLPIRSGQATIFGHDVATNPAIIRQLIGVTFQSPSVDGKLTVAENLRHQGHLYGLSGRLASERIDELLERLGLSDRRRDRVDSLSGGLKRRVEVAKSLLHRPQLLLLDEPSTGLDPGARRDMWDYLTRLRQDNGTTIVVTTHLMEEADHCDRLGILDQGQIVALGTPDELRLSVGGDCLTIQSSQPDSLSEKIARQFNITPRRIGDALRIEHDAGHELLRDLVATFPNDIKAISLAKPTLEDVFTARTGHLF